MPIVADSPQFVHNNGATKDDNPAPEIVVTKLIIWLQNGLKPMLSFQKIG